MKRPFKDTISVEDAPRLNEQAPFSLMLKPIGPSCNLRCSYCYYLDKSGLFGGQVRMMSEELLEASIRNYFDSLPPEADAAFDWHGGEPLLRELTFYMKAVQLQKRFAGGRKIYNTLQTNGTLVDDRWADFFRKENFLIGISIDGPEDIHNANRKDAGGSPTFDKVLRGIRTLQRHGVDFNTMSAISKAAEGRGAQVYDFLKAIGSRYMQFMPVVEFVGEGGISAPDSIGTHIAEWSISSEGWGKFLCDIFDKWVRTDVGQVFVNHFDAALCSWCGENRGTCIYDRTCRPNAVIEHNGDVFPCDHFVYPEFKMGNVRSASLRDVVNSPGMVRFCLEKRNSLPPKCLRCEYGFACGGECPKHRREGLNLLCDGYFNFFRHAAPYLDRMRDLLSKGRAPAEIMFNLPK